MSDIVKANFISKDEILCGASESQCKCILAPHEDEIAHLCECGGSWIYENGEFVVVTYPTIPGMTLIDLFGFGFGS